MGDADRAWGILGGTFDPIHLAHLRLASHAYRELGLEKVIFMPSYIPPHKIGRNITSEQHRLAMTRLAIEEYGCFEVSDMELGLSGASYTARTLTLFHEEHERLVFIVGADSFMALDDWYHPEIIFENAEIACACRDGISADRLNDRAKFYKDKYGGISHILRMEDTDISSTAIRRMLADGKDVSSYIPKAVCEYIRQNGLYMDSEDN